MWIPNLIGVIIYESLHSSFWSLSKGQLRKEEANQAKKRVQEVIGWKDPIEEKMGLVDTVAKTKKV